MQREREKRRDTQTHLAKDQIGKEYDHDDTGNHETPIRCLGGEKGSKGQGRWVGWVNWEAAWVGCLGSGLGGGCWGGRFGCEDWEKGW